MNPLDYVYDLESYPNFFSCVVKHRYSGTRWIFEVSERHNNAPQFISFILELERFSCRMIGFNNHGYDWQVIEHLLKIGPTFTAADAYAATDFIINGDRESKFRSMVWDRNQRIQQIDLMMIHHFDNFAKATSLKELEFNMRSKNIGDLPYPPGEPIPAEGFDTVIEYNCHDVEETEKFAEYSRPMIEFREQLIDTMGSEVLCYNDTKIGKKRFEKELRERTPHVLGSRGEKRQTHREFIRLSDVIIPTIGFETPELQRVHATLMSTVITQTKSPPELKDISATLRNFTVHVGAGGGHGSVSRRHVKPANGWRLVDVDVASYYPNIAIANRFYPAHLSEAFCDIYADVAEQRKMHKKKTAPNEMLKLALNGVYGDSGNVHSIFYDPQYTMQITINGQLLLYLLMEKIILHTRGEMIQLNTDGITFLIPEEEYDRAKEICEWWESFTGLTLEYADYSDMWIRDVNNYVARSTDGYVKRIGAYAFETQRENPATREVKWSKDHSALVVQKAAVAAMVDGTPVRKFIESHDDAFDFMLRMKGSRSVRLRLMRPGDVDFDSDYPDAGQWLQRVTRYVIAKSGGRLQKIHPPLRKSPNRWRSIGVHVGHDVAICDDLSDYDPSNVNLEWYIAEAEKLVIASTSDVTSRVSRCLRCGKDTMRPITEPGACVC